MKDDISVEAACCKHSLVLFLRGRHALPHLGKQLFTARRAMSGEILVYGRIS